MSTMDKSGTQSSRRGPLSFERRRLIAKDIVSGKPAKQILADWNISYDTLWRIRRRFVIETLSERYPDQIELGL